ncbi:hypothetical protein N7478_007823 [Penicillium angulare]|uniref:uncharacterized protein n=1 Tax=Penicillium angulare TaxID=116970 RepID=UPI00254267E6|nr:uncharacterized protein N7478_007823 [Penicillium angulare]KAJ5272698.1 hypothetical protein N7478_007823 [Penicillium angulare]
MTDAVSIEQTNKIRISLGLPPLAVPGATGPAFQDDDSSSGSEDEEDPASTIETRQAEGYDNWKKLQDESDAKRRREEKNAAIKKARDEAQRKLQLEGTTLGDAEGPDLDTKAWLMQSKKRTKKIEKERARKLAQEFEEREREAAIQYTAADLAGVKVGHSMRAFEGGEDHILTLKDAGIDEEEEGDELEDVNLAEKEKADERNELKKRKPVYDPTAENQGILSHYDEEIEGKKRKRFTLDAKGSTEEEREAKRQEVSNKLKMGSISLDLEPEIPASDYMDISEVKIKKPKKKKSKTTKQRATIEDDDLFPPTESNGASMEVDSANGVPVVAPRKPIDQNVSFVDDDDLQASLALQRRAAFKKRKKMRPEDLAQQLREEESQTPMEVETPGDETEEPGLVIDETSEFISNLQKPTIPEKEERRKSTPMEDGAPQPEHEDELQDVDMERSYNDIEDDEDLAERLKQAQSEEAKQELTGTGLEEESTLDQGLGATLAMLRQRGLVKKETNSSENNVLTRDRQRFLQDKLNREADADRRARLQRERDRASGKLDRMTAREREEYARWENKQRDQQEARQMAEIFSKEYKPDVQLKYTDEYGRAMNQKEAFKHLSHQFHGKGSGKMKTEKRLKKIEDEQKQEAMSTLDSSQHTGMNNAMGAQARKNRQAGVRLG